MTEVNRSVVDGFEVVELVNHCLHMRVVPASGAKIVSLVHLRTGREWMWKPEPNPRYFRVSTETPFDKGPFLGADECLPTLAACRWRSRDLPDHGEAWSQTWALDEAQLADGCTATRLKTPISPLFIERALRLDHDRLRFDYRLENLDGRPQEYLWALHPMMTIESGDRILLPETCRRVRMDACMGGCPLGIRGDGWSWPRPTAEIDLSRLDLGGEGRTVKLYTEPLTEGRASLLNCTLGNLVQLRENCYC